MKGNDTFKDIRNGWLSKDKDGKITLHQQNNYLIRRKNE